MWSLLLIGVAIAATSDATSLDGESFDAFVARERITMIEFYAPWCGHCKKLAPHYSKAAVTLSRLEEPLALGKVDCTTDKELCTRFAVRGYPTLKMFVDGQISSDPYTGKRDAESLVEYLVEYRDEHPKAALEEEDGAKEEL